MEEAKKKKIDKEEYQRMLEELKAIKSVADTIAKELVDELDDVELEKTEKALDEQTKIDKSAEDTQHAPRASDTRTK